MHDEKIFLSHVCALNFWTACVLGRYCPFLPKRFTRSSGKDDQDCFRSKGVFMLAKDIYV